MKPKALKKRLVLNKKTIVNLKKTEMNEAYGGESGRRNCIVEPTLCIGPVGGSTCTVTLAYITCNC